MGLLDSIYRLSLRKTGSISKDLTSTGVIVELSNTAAYDELILDVTLTITGGLSSPFTINVLDLPNSLLITGFRDSDGNSLDFTDTYTKLHRITPLCFSPSPMEEQTITKRIIIPITGISSVRVTCGVAATPVTGGACTLTGSYTLKQGSTYTPNPVQRLKKVVESGDGTTTNFTTGRMFIPRNAKFVFASVRVVNGSSAVAQSGEMSFYWRNNPIGSASSTLAEDVVMSKENILFENSFACPWQEVAAESVQAYVKFDSAPAAGTSVILNLYTVL